MGVLKAKVGGSWVNIGAGGGSPYPGGQAGEILVKQSETANDLLWTTSLPKLALTSPDVVTLAGTTHPLTLGTLAGTNLGMYSTGIQARNTGAISTLRLNYYGGLVVIGGAHTDPTMSMLRIEDSAHATSRRASIALGSGWSIGQDWNQVGDKDFYVYGQILGATPLRISSNGKQLALGGGASTEVFFASNGSFAGPKILSNGSYLVLSPTTDSYIDGANQYFRTLAGVTKFQMDTIVQTINPYRFQVNYNNQDYGWGNPCLLVYCNNGSVPPTSMAMHYPGVAPILRVSSANGEKIGCNNNGQTAYAPLQASAFEVNSSAAIKRDVRQLREWITPVTTQLESDADVVPLIDVMSLRPIAFRPKVAALRIVPVDGESYTTDPSTFTIEDEIGVLGHEGQRERLGLIAEEVATVLPSAVTHTQDGECFGIDYAQVTVALLDHVQQLTDRIATLEALL